MKKSVLTLICVFLAMLLAVTSFICVKYVFGDVRIDYVLRTETDTVLLCTKSIRRGQVPGVIEIDEDILDKYTFDNSWRDEAELPADNDKTIYIDASEKAILSAVVYFNGSDWRCDYISTISGEHMHFPSSSGADNSTLSWNIVSHLSVSGSSLPSHENGYIVPSDIFDSVDENCVFSSAEIKMAGSGFSFASKGEVLSVIAASDISDRLSFVCTAEYSKSINIKFVTGKNAEQTHDNLYCYGDRFTNIDNGEIEGLHFVGWDCNGDGISEYGANETLPAATVDTVYTALYTTDQCDIKVYVFDPVASDYTVSEEFSALSSETIGKPHFQNIISASTPESGITYKLIEWQYSTNNGEWVSCAIPENVVITGNTRFRPLLNRYDLITFDPGDGIITGSESDGKLRVNIVHGQSFVIDTDCYKPDGYDICYELIGWLDTESQITYNVNDTITVISPMKLTAVFSENEFMYKVEVSTLYGSLINGKKSDIYRGDYEGRCAFIEKYADWLPEGFAHDGFFWSCNSYSQSTNGNMTVISYDNWDSARIRFTVTLDSSGGSINPISTDRINVIGTGAIQSEFEYGSIVTPSSLAFPTKRVDSKEYVLIGWRDDDGNEFGVFDSVTVFSDVTLYAVWQDKYPLTIVVNGMISDVLYISEGDILKEPDMPEAAIGCAWDGWSWSRGVVSLDSMPLTMPPYPLTVSCEYVPCFVVYICDGKVVGSSFTPVGSQVAISAKPESYGRTYSDWETDSITTDAGMFTMPSHDVTFISASTPNTHTVTYTVNGKVFGDVDTQNCGDRVPIRDNASFEGMIFGGWSCGETVLGGYFTMPDDDVVISATAVADSFTITYYVDGNPVYTDTVLFGDSVTIRDPEQRDGFEFSGWHCSEEDLSSGVITMCAHDLVIFGHFDTLLHTLFLRVPEKNIVNALSFRAGDSVNTNEFYYSGDDWRTVSWTLSDTSVVIEDGCFIMPDSDITATAVCDSCLFISDGETKYAFDDENHDSDVFRRIFVPYSENGYFNSDAEIILISSDCLTVSGKLPYEKLQNNTSLFIIIDCGVENVTLRNVEAFANVDGISRYVSDNLPTLNVPFGFSQANYCCDCLLFCRSFNLLTVNIEETVILRADSTNTSSAVIGAHDISSSVGEEGNTVVATLIKLSGSGTAPYLSLESEGITAIKSQSGSLICENINLYISTGGGNGIDVYGNFTAVNCDIAIDTYSENITNPYAVVTWCDAEEEFLTVISCSFNANGVVSGFGDARFSGQTQLGVLYSHPDATLIFKPTGKTAFDDVPEIILSSHPKPFVTKSLVFLAGENSNYAIDLPCIPLPTFITATHGDVSVALDSSIFDFISDEMYISSTTDTYTFGLDSNMAKEVAFYVRITGDIEG